MFTNPPPLHRELLGQRRLGRSCHTLGLDVADQSINVHPIRFSQVIWRNTTHHPRDHSLVGDVHLFWGPFKGCFHVKGMELLWLISVIANSEIPNHWSSPHPGMPHLEPCHPHTPAPVDNVDFPFYHCSLEVHHSSWTIHSRPTALLWNTTTGKSDKPTWEVECIITMEGIWNCMIPNIPMYYQA